MDKLSDFGINIQGLENKRYEFEYQIDGGFFNNFENSEIKKGNLICKTVIEKTSSFIRVNIFIDGFIELICDRSLDPFNHDIHTNGLIIYKYGAEMKEIDDEIIIIPRNHQEINLAQPIYEFISLSVPMKKLHPRYRNQDMQNDELIYTTGPDKPGNNEDNAEIDPRWETLKKLKNNKEK